METHDHHPLPATSLPGRIALWVATGLGVGLVTPFPGTLGGLLGVPLAALVCRLDSVGVQIALVAALVLAAVPICTAAQRALGGGHDPQAIVLDEIIVLPIVFVGVGPATWPRLLAGYLLFRLCDSAKPGLVGSAEKLPAGWGIMADDTLAAVLACLLLHATLGLDQWLQWGWLAA